MPIVKTVNSPNGTELTYHVVHKVETSERFDSAVIYVRGYATQVGAERSAPLAWLWQLTAPIEAITSLTSAFIETLLVSDPGSPFFGGDILTAETDMEKAKRQKYMEIKRSRDQQEFSTFTFEGNTYDCNQISQQRIGQAAQGAMFAISVGAPFTQDWTLKDNSVVTFDAQQMIGVALAMGAHVSLAHERGRMLREQLEAALTVEDVAAVTWPSAA